ncbi:hypothetical protein CLV86_2253 [Lacinutrix venerupis]|uniref:hypothetical protein n=1 Tax=Lacinutrix venerupis TaxID=1486034 RepID=UPI000EAFF386|nr:hypothetical protein [Lacinutrix venerupis]RLJ61860.1 hypothetical protein CLV86_2253 [Lacinutrix venerupis]
MKAAILALFFLFTLANSCKNDDKESIKLSEQNHLTEAQLFTLHKKNSDERYENTTSLDSIPIGGGDPLPPCPDSSYTDCCPTLRYVTFKKGTKNITIILLDENNKEVQKFTESDLETNKDGSLIFSLKKLKASICNGENKLKVKSGNKRPYVVKFK